MEAQILSALQEIRTAQSNLISGMDRLQARVAHIEGATRQRCPAPSSLGPNPLGPHSHGAQPGQPPFATHPVRSLLDLPAPQDSLRRERGIPSLLPPPRQTRGVPLPPPPPSNTWIGAPLRHRRSAQDRPPTRIAGRVPRPLQPYNQENQNNTQGDREISRGGKEIKKYVQICNHSKNWSVFPKSLKRDLGTYFDSIHVPGMDAEFNAKMKALQDSTERAMLEAVGEHLNRRREQITEDLRKMGGRRVGEMVSLARKYISDHYGRKLKESDREKWVAEARDLIAGVEPDGAQTQGEGVTQGAMVDLTPACPTLNAGFRLRREGAPISTSNRFEALGEMRSEDSDETIDRVSPPKNKRQDIKSTPPRTTEAAPQQAKEPGHRTTPPPSPTQLHSPSPPPRSQDVSSFFAPRSSTGGSSSQPERRGRGPTIHTGGMNKKDWKLDIRPGTKTLIISDSNFKRARDFPGDWQVEVFSGCQIGNMFRILHNYNFGVGRKPERIIISVGINNRAWLWASVVKELNQLIRQLLDSEVPTFFLAIPIPQDLPDKEQELLRQINDHVERRAPNAFVESIQTSDIKTDQDRIHYKQDTIDMIMHSLKNHFLGGIRVPPNPPSQ